MASPQNHVVYTIPTLILAAKTLFDNEFPITSDNSKYTTYLAQHMYEVADGVEFDFHLHGREATNEESLSQLIWSIGTNHSYQGDPIHEFTNGLILSGVAGFKNLNKDATEIDQVFLKSIGVPAKEYLMLIFAIWAHAIDHVSINSEIVFGNSAAGASAKSALKKVLEMMSFKCSEPLSSEVFSHASAYTGKAIAESIFTRKPLIKVDESTYAISGHPFIQLQWTKRFLLVSRALAQRLSSGNSRTKLSQVIGERQEKFFAHLTTGWSKDSNFDEYEWSNRGNQKSPDRILFEKFGNNSEAVTLFQLKAKSLREGTLFARDFNDAVCDLGSSFNEMIYKSINFLWSLHEAAKNNSLNSLNSKLSLRILNSRECVLIGVCPDVPPIFSMKPIRDLLEAEIIKEVGLDKWQWLHQHFKNVYWHIISLTEFQAFLCIPDRRRNFHKAIKHYFRDEQIDRFLSRGDRSLPSSFRSFIIANYGTERDENSDRKINSIPDLRHIYDEFFEEAKQYLEFLKKQ